MFALLLYMVRIQIRLTKSDDWDSVTFKDLSAGGILFFYKQALEIGTHIDLKIDLSESTPTINCVGKIIRIDKLKPTSMYFITIEFIDIVEQEKELLNKSIEEI